MYAILCVAECSLTEQPSNQSRARARNHETFLRHPRSTLHPPTLRGCVLCYMYVTYNMPLACVCKLRFLQRRMKQQDGRTATRQTSMAAVAAELGHGAWEARPPDESCPYLHTHSNEMPTTCWTCCICFRFDFLHKLLRILQCKLLAQLLCFFTSALQLMH